MGNKSQGTDHQDRKLSIAFAESRRSSKWKNTGMYWTDLVQKLTTTIRTKETAADYASFPKSQRDQIKDSSCNHAALLTFISSTKETGYHRNASVQVEV